MPAYILIDLSIHNPQEMEEYKKLAPATVSAFGGKFIVRGGATTTLEGKWEPDRLVVIEFPSTEQAHDWWNSEMYAQAKAIRQGAADTRMILVEGV